MLHKEYEDIYIYRGSGDSVREKGGFVPRPCLAKCCTKSIRTHTNTHIHIERERETEREREHQPASVQFLHANELLYPRT
jgi:hypothetical protein